MTDEEYEENVEMKEEKETLLPSAVMERLEKYAQRTKQNIDDMLTQYFTFIQGFGCENWRDEDADLLEDWAEQMLVETRNVSSGGMAGSEAFVGCFVGVDQRQRDRREGLVNRARRDFALDPNAAISSGQVGHYTKGEVNWVLHGNNGSVDTTTPKDEVPEHSFVADGERICLLAKSGRPKAMSLMGRYYYFLGAPESEFTNDGAIRLWRVDCQGEDANMEITVGEACRIPARLPNENANEAYKDVLSVPLGLNQKIEWPDNFVSEDIRGELAPSKFWTNGELHGLHTRLDELVEAYEAGSRTFTIRGEEGRSGPIVFAAGTINRMSTEGRESEFDETGRSYSLALTSQALQSSHGHQNDLSEVMCWISGACHDLTNPFMARSNGELVPYAEKSFVIVCGRIGMKRKDGEDIPNLKVMGVHPVPRRFRRRQEGGDTGASQFQ